MVLEFCRWFNTLGVFLVLFAVALGQSSEDSVRYVLLNHGSVVRGQVQLQGDRYQISIDRGNHILLDAKQVLYIGESLESLYRYQVGLVKQWGTGEHWQLTEWCIQQGMLDQAVSHFQEIEKRAPDTQNFKQLEFRLKNALIAKLKQNQVATGDGNASSSTTSHVEKASAESSNDSPSNVTSLSAQRPSPLIASELSSAVHKSFQSEVLPVLVQRCGQSGCHARPTSDFRINQPVGDQAALILERDLTQVLRFINPNNPTESELLTYAVQRHGIQQKPSLNVLRDDDRILADRIEGWIRSLVVTQPLPQSMPSQYPLPSNSQASESITAKKSTSSSSGRRGSNRWSNDVQRDRNAKLSKPPKSGSPPVVLSGSEINEIEDAIATLEKKQDSAPKTNDPFDPNLFNQRFGTQKP